MKKPTIKAAQPDARYQSIFGDVSRIIDAARESAARSVNAVMTAAYWLIGQHIVEFEQEGTRGFQPGRKATTSSDKVTQDAERLVKEPRFSVHQVLPKRPREERISFPRHP